MQVGVLGPLLVHVQDRDVTPNGQRLRDAFVVLLQRRGRPVPAEVLLSLVWGDRVGDPGVSAVHTTVARLRKLLGQDAIVSRDAGYLVDAAVTTDEDLFGELLSRGRDLVGREEHAAAATAYREALARWRGREAFQDVRAELVEADRSRLEELRASAVEELAALLLDRPGPGGPAEALVLASGLITDQPLRERPYQLAMLAAYRCQRQADALDLFQMLRRRLRSDLGIEPAAATAELQARILRQDPALDEPTPARRLPTSSSPRANRLPAPVSPLIGRERELSTLDHALDNGRRLITLIGPGGVGKTRLLVELGVRRQDLVDISYAELSGLGAAEPDDVAVAIFVAGALGGSESRPLDSLLAALGDDAHLLLVDEAEWVAGPVAGVMSAILHSCRGTQIVVTSRIPLDVAGEVLVAVEPLACPEPDALPADIRSAPAVRLLAERLSDRGVPPDPDAAGLLASIARKVDGLPLGLELAAGQASGRSLAELAALVESPLDVPATQHPQNPRHRSLRDTLAWSLTRVEPPARAVLHRLSVFVGPFELDAARAVTAGVEHIDVDAIVRSLARDALLHIERTSLSRINFRLLRTVRELAAEGLDPEQRLLARALHRRWHAGRWRTGGNDLVEDVRAHLDDYLEALRSAVDSRDVTTVADLTITLSRFWQVVGGQATGLRWIGIVLDSDILGAGDRARVLVQRAALALNHDPAIVLADTAAAIPLLEATGLASYTVTAVSVRALELLAQGRLSEATAHADRAVEFARGRTPEELANALGTQAVIYAVVESPEKSSAAIDEAVARLRDRAPSLEGVEAVSAIALALVNLERFPDAVALLDGTEIPAAATPPPARYQLTLGWACVGAGDFTRALACFLGAVPTPVHRRTADRHAAETVLGAACSLAALGDPAAPGALAGALELLARVDYRSPPALQRAITRARMQVADGPLPAVGGEPTAALLERLERNLLRPAESAQSGSAAG